MKHSDLLKTGIPKDCVALVHPAPPCGYGPDTSSHWDSELLHLPESEGDNKSDMEIENAPVAIGY